MIERTATSEIKELASSFKALAIVGPRQSGKTTLTKYIFKSKPYASLENPDTRLFAVNDPKGFLEQFPHGAVLDEVQRVPVLFSYLQQIIMKKKSQGNLFLPGLIIFCYRRIYPKVLPEGSLIYFYFLFRWRNYQKLSLCQ